MTITSSSSTTTIIQWERNKRLAEAMYTKNAEEYEEE